jgi:hypothetical protein
VMTDKVLPIVPLLLCCCSLLRSHLSRHSMMRALCRHPHQKQHSSTAEQPNAHTSSTHSSSAQCWHQLHLRGAEVAQQYALLAKVQLLGVCRCVCCYQELHGHLLG